MHELAMELRSVDEPQRLVVGVVVPYDELTYLTPDPRGERVKRGAFARSIAHRGDRIDRSQLCAAIWRDCASVIA